MSDENGDDNSAEKPVVIAIGTSFPSFDVLSTAIKNWELQNCVQLYVRDSRSVEAARKRATKKTYKQELGFSEIRYACIHGGRKYRSQSLGKRSVKGYVPYHYVVSPLFVPFLYALPANMFDIKRFLPL